MTPITSACGTFETSGDVRCLVAIGRKADIEQSRTQKHDALIFQGPLLSLARRKL
jgi:hypothetical protein